MSRFTVYCLPVLFLFVIQNSFAQNIVIGNDKANRPLTWNDFGGKVDKQSPFAATTYWDIKFNFESKGFKGDTVICEFDVTLSLSDKSWVKNDKKTDYLLGHEQKHFDIGILCAREMLGKFKAASFLKKDYRAQVYAIYYDTMKKYREMQIQYDKETAHSIKEDEQRKWDAFVSAELEKSNT